MKYEPQVIEEKWQKKWDEEKAFKVTEDPQELPADSGYKLQKVGGTILEMVK